MVYLWEQHGPEAIRAVIESPYEGMAALGEALASQDVDLADFFSASWWRSAPTTIPPQTRPSRVFACLALRSGPGFGPPMGDAYTIPQFTPRYPI